MSKTAHLHLRIEAQGKNSDFVLQVGVPFFIGRSPDVDLQIDADSISQKHLELLWDASVLRVRDLESSNGSFRMPQDSPFLEAHFGPRDREIRLKLAKTLVTISWKDIETSAEEKTEVLDVDPPMAPSALPQIETRAAGAQSNIAVAPKRIEKRPESSEQISVWARPIFLAGVLVFAVQNFYFFSQHASFLTTSPAWVLGPAIDFYLLWLGDLPVFTGVWGVGILVALLLKKRLDPCASNSRTRLLGGLGVLLMLAVLVWPLVFLRASGNPGATRTAVSEFLNLRTQVETHNFSQKEKNLQISSKLTDLSLLLKGSSAFYAFWHNFQKKRVVDECGGVGEGSWEKKRLCLVLLYALSLDGYTSIRPIFLGPTASSLVFLSSLDGVIRVLAAEGPGSENIKLFISSLDDAGLRKEAQYFVGLVQEFKGKSFEELMTALLELRLSVERKVFESQSTAGLPSSLKLNLMGPLEMGI